MNMKSKCILALAGATLATIALAAEPLSKEQVKALSDLGTKAFGIKWSGPLVGGSDKNVHAVSDGTTTLTTRKGSRTFIINNKKLTESLGQLDYAGKDEALQRIGMRALQNAGANLREIAEVRVLQQITQSALSNPKSGELKLQPAKLSLRTLMITRQIEGIPVISSRTVLNVDRTGQPAFMELSWPDISPEVLDKAQRLRKLAAHSYDAPRVEGAKVESVQAVILHSPAIGFYDDSTAAIRVIYRADSPTTGKLAVRYLDETGKDVSIPRQIETPREEPVKRPEAKG